MTKFWSSMAKRAEPYVPGLQVNKPNIIKLNTNENAYPPSPKVMQAIQMEAGENLKLYPSPTADDLRKSIASFNNLEHDQVFVGIGSDTVLVFSFLTFYESIKKFHYL